MRISGMRRVKTLEAIHRARIVEQIEVLIPVAHQRIEVQGICMRMGSSGQAGRCDQYNRYAQFAYRAPSLLHHQLLLRSTLRLRG